MIDRVLVLALAGSAVFGVLLFWEWQTGSPAEQSRSAANVAVSGEQQPALPQTQRPPVAELVATTLERPLFAVTRRPPPRVAGNQATEPGLPNLRLTGIVIEPQHHIAIFVGPGTKPLALTEGERINDWLLETIAPREVTLSGAAGTATLEPKTDPNLVRPSPAQPQAKSVAPTPAPAPRPRADGANRQQAPALVPRGAPPRIAPAIAPGPMRVPIVPKASQ